MKVIFFVISLFYLSILYASPKYIGDKSCAKCHADIYKQWKGSHHDLSMQVANEKTVLGNFNNASFISKSKIKTTFFKKDKKFFVNTDGEDGKLHNYEIAYVFGVYPLQQYMIKFPKGKIQVLDIAWDSRNKKDGGQHWYHLHPHVEIKSDDILHWTSPNLNWNFMCADCHSTNVKKNYNPKTKTFNTTFDVINVSCESCHGPASGHEKMINSGKKGKNGLAFHLKKSSELDVCAKCHSRRTPLDDDFSPGDNFFDHYKNVNLNEGLYFSDGKIKDEVYVYNSFKQSKMYEQGVSCSDCHNPHSLEHKAVGEKVCYQCHTPKKYTEKKHHKHKVASQGSSCISCHMPSRVYMGVDERNDHSFRVPRPDLSVGSDIPNACNNCHKDKSADWATEAMLKWYKKVPIGKQNFSHALEALRRNDKNGQKYLYDVLMSDAPNIAKATVVEYLGNYKSLKSYKKILELLKSDDLEIRLNALHSLESYPIKYRLALTFNLLEDKRNIIQMEATRQLLNLPKKTFDIHQNKIFNKYIKKYKRMLLFNADRAQTQNNLAHLYTNLEEFDKVEESYTEALRIEPMFMPTYINYAYYFQKLGEEKKALFILEKALEIENKNADIYHALGLWYIRNKNNNKGLHLLQKAAKLSPTNVKYVYVYAIALAEVDKKAAIVVLEDNIKLHTGNKESILALKYYKSLAF
ncbi:multiheme c-type cytochrome [Sulfurimonas sp.]|uniref:multiheme c-type cytochrome n=1 Tax=Sulfurimonas sp. TaxID=2022749 RepID=UPI002AB247F2|nr:multiheme c-type cytochrome [Sulfurimonas sp.]